MRPMFRKLVDLLFTFKTRLCIFNSVHMALFRQIKFASQNGNFLEELVSARFTEKERCNMLLLLLVVSTHFSTPALC